jgi:hypothetical protein
MAERIFDFDMAEAMWTLGLLTSDMLPGIAVRALEAGLDSPSLRQLAGLDSTDLAEAEHLFRKTLSELGREILTTRQAALNYAFYISQEICSGREEPYSGARKIWKATLAVEDKPFHDLDPFVYAFSEYASRPEDRGLFSAGIIKEAARVVEQFSKTKP